MTDVTPLRRSALVAAALAPALLFGPPEARALIKNPPIYDKPPEALPLGEPEPQFPVGAQWSLTAVNGKPVGGDAPSFTLDDKLRATGFSGCNTYSMTLYPIKGQKLAAGSIALTRKECDKDTMLLEHNFLITLHSLPVWSIENGDLVIKVKDMSLRLRRAM